MTVQEQAYLRLHFGILLAGATGIFGRLLSLSEIPLVWYRIMIAGIVMAIIMKISGILHRITLREFALIGGCGLLLAIHWVCFYGSIKASNVSIAVVCIALDGFFTALIEPLVHRHRPSWNELLLSMIAVAGILLIFGLDARYRLGIVLGTVCSLVYAIFSICSKQVQVITSKSSSTMLIYELLGGFLMLTLVMPFYSHISPETHLLPSGNDWIYLPIFASIFTVVPFLMQLQALRHISAFTVNLSYNLEPIYSVLLAMIIFDEASELDRSFWIGVVMIILSVALQTLRSRRHKTL